MMNRRWFNLCHFCFKTKVTLTSVIKLQYANVCTCTHSESKFQVIIESFTEAYKITELTVNSCKAGAFVQPVAIAQILSSTTHTNSKDLRCNIGKRVHFLYPGSHSSPQATLMMKFIMASSPPFSCLRKIIFKD